jgi:HSP20 family protein
MLMRSDPFRDLDRLAQAAFGTRMRPAAMAMDAYRQGDEFKIHFDLPGIDPSSIDLTIERNALTVSAQRDWQPGEDVQVVAAERPQGTFSRELFLGDGLDADRVEATYANGVLTVTVPVAERAKPRKVEIGGGNGKATPIETSSREG